MTATIGVLCDLNHKTQRGNIILSSDELITYSSSGVPVSSNGHGHKIYDLPCGFYVAIADDISRSHQVVSFLHHRLKELKLRRSDTHTTDTVKLALAASGIQETASARMKTALNARKKPIFWRIWHNAKLFSLPSEGAARISGLHGADRYGGLDQRRIAGTA
jgi:hypothetical protein